MPVQLICTVVRQSISLVVLDARRFWAAGEVKLHTLHDYMHCKRFGLSIAHEACSL
jgi:hypothetical protein